MRMLIIRHTSPNADKSARMCIIGRDMRWLEEQRGVLSFKAPRDRAYISQGDEILHDPDHLLEDTEISNRWIADYNSEFCGDVEFDTNNAMELRISDQGWWKQVGEDVNQEFMYAIFSSSYGGDGIRLPMILNDHGKSIMNNKRGEP